MRVNIELIIKILALIFPILLFVFKSILPSIAEAVYKNKTRETEQAKIELLHFPVDLLFVAISYNIPKIIEVFTDLFYFSELNNDNIKKYQELILSNVLYSSTTFFLLLIIPFYVFGTRIAEKQYFSGKKKTVFCIEIPLYIGAIFLIWVSLFL